jgi:hypothetical protein
VVPIAFNAAGASAANASIVRDTVGPEAQPFTSTVAVVSVGIVGGVLLPELDDEEDVKAETEAVRFFSDEICAICRARVDVCGRWILTASLWARAPVRPATGSLAAARARSPSSGQPCPPTRNKARRCRYQALR